jgi:nucleoid-associated protein YgaU
MNVRSETHAPPRLLLTWGEGGKLFNNAGTAVPWCVLESASQEFTLFSPGGVPLRAKMNVSFRDAWTIDEQLAQTPRESSDRTKYVQVKERETLSAIARKQYADPAQWRPIADANQIANPRVLVPGMVLKIPSLTAGSS